MGAALAARASGSSAARQPGQADGAVADACLARRRRVVGVIPRGAVRPRRWSTGLDKLHGSHHARAQRRSSPRLPQRQVPGPSGGLGTLDERLCEVATWAQLGLHAALVLVDADSWDRSRRCSTAWSAPTSASRQPGADPLRTGGARRASRCS
ncbi:MAG: LOG family protein [Microthrixaceae bacterium]|nr:LOG family protein [Microthrixaceae bacterium]